MDVVVFAAILIGLAAFVAAPLYRTDNAPIATPPPLDAGAQREAAERAIEDLEVDRASGLVDDASYARERTALDQPPD